MYAIFNKSCHNWAGKITEHYMIKRFCRTLICRTKHTHTHTCAHAHIHIHTAHAQEHCISDITCLLNPSHMHGHDPKSSPCGWQEIIIIIRCLNISPLFTLVQHNTMIHKALYIMLFCVNREYLSHTRYRRDRFYYCTELSEVFLCM